MNPRDVRRYDRRFSITLSQPAFDVWDAYTTLRARSSATSGHCSHSSCLSEILGSHLLDMEDFRGNPVVVMATLTKAASQLARRDPVALFVSDEGLQGWGPWGSRTPGAFVKKSVSMWVEVADELDALTTRLRRSGSLSRRLSRGDVATLLLLWSVASEAQQQHPLFSALNLALTKLL